MKVPWQSEKHSQH